MKAASPNDDGRAWRVVLWRLGLLYAWLGLAVLALLLAFLRLRALLLRYRPRPVTSAASSGTLAPATAWSPPQQQQQILQQQQGVGSDLLLNRLLAYPVILLLCYTPAAVSRLAYTGAAEPPPLWLAALQVVLSGLVRQPGRREGGRQGGREVGREISSSRCLW